MKRTSIALAIIVIGVCGFSDTEAFLPSDRMS